MADKSEALRRAAEFLASAVRHAAPSAKAADSFRVRASGQGFIISSPDNGAKATEMNLRHMTFGNRDAKWHNTNDKAPGRTGWASRALLERANRAAEMFGDSYVEALAIESPIFEVER
jgi:hypothetical protein